MKKIVIPQFGETTEEEITIVRWLKQPGDTVKTGEVLLEVETNKALLQIEAIDCGTLLTITKQGGELVKPGEVVGFIQE
ncbi:hypothetical protein ES705_15196 [subsurface metagenome]|jgi:pyruvate/2-oxoglutarate dehydrogenase complex dihydrolipoamide acyltransferase (E2) component